MESFLNALQIEELNLYRKQKHLPGYCFDLGDALVSVLPGQISHISFLVGIKDIELPPAIILNCWHNRIHYHIEIIETSVDCDIKCYDREKNLIECMTEQYILYEDNLDDCVGKIVSLIPKTNKL